VTRKNYHVLGSYPSTMLRMVPLPIAFGDREDELRLASLAAI
jgi:hypothetical protein